jgi:hypothetical protein
LREREREPFTREKNFPYMICHTRKFFRCDKKLVSDVTLWKEEVFLDEIGQKGYFSLVTVKPNGFLYTY